MEQAAAAAVLRSGYMTHKGTPDEPLLAIDLSSERVRNALCLLHGVQQGQSLNALLGYLFESGSADLSLQKYIQPFRDAFPVVGTKLTPSSAPSEAIAASNVVDGLALRTAWDAGKLVAGQNWGAGLPPPGADQAAVITVLKSSTTTPTRLGRPLDGRSGLSDHPRQFRPRRRPDGRHFEGRQAALTRTSSPRRGAAST